MAAPVDQTALACLFRSLGDSSRLSILSVLAERELRVVDLTTMLGLAQSTVSAHLACLRDCGLVTARTQGRASLYSVEAFAVWDVIDAAQSLLHQTGAAVESCVTYGSAR